MYPERARVVVIGTEKNRHLRLNINIQTDRELSKKISFWKQNILAAKIREEKSKN